jgi:hypothetical protein
MERYLCYSIRVCRLVREEKERTMDLAMFEFCTRSLKKVTFEAYANPLPLHACPDGTRLV